MIICNDKMPTRNQMEGENKKKGKKRKKRFQSGKKKERKENVFDVDDALLPLD